MDNQEFINKCKSIIVAEGEGEGSVTSDEIFVVWSCKTLQNNKAILSTTQKGAPLFEMTHNGDKSEIYMDIYTKQVNKAIKV